MKRLILAACVFLSIGTGVGAIAQTPTQPTTKPNRAEPTSTTTPDNTRYLNRPAMLTNCEKQVAPFKDKPCDIIFIGDSITAGWLGNGKQIWAEKYVPRNALDFGIGGDKTQNVLWRLENMDVKHLRPKVAVVLIGTNNTMNTPQEIGDGVKAVLDDTQSDFPGVKIILISIMPNRRANEKMMAANTIIKQFADEKTVYYLDLVARMPPVETTGADGKTDTNWKGLGKDHLHPDAAGYKIWADAMEPLLSKLLAGEQGK